MAFRVRKRIKIAPGINVNVGKTGVNSASFGKRGASVNVGKRGVYGNVGIKGTGVSYRTRLDSTKNTNSKSTNSQTMPKEERRNGKIFLYLAIISLLLGVFITGFWGFVIFFLSMVFVMLTLHLGTVFIFGIINLLVGIFANGTTSFFGYLFAAVLIIGGFSLISIENEEKSRGEE